MYFFSPCFLNTNLIQSNSSMPVIRITSIGSSLPRPLKTHTLMVLPSRLLCSNNSLGGLTTAPWLAWVTLAAVSRIRLSKVSLSKADTASIRSRMISVREGAHRHDSPLSCVLVLIHISPILIISFCPVLCCFIFHFKESAASWSRGLALLRLQSSVLSYSFPSTSIPFPDALLR